MNNLKNLLLTASLLAFWGCSNPADNVPAAKVSATNSAAIASASAAPPAATTRAYALAPENSSIDFVGSKVTGSHKGGFKKFDGQIAVDNGHVANTGNK